MEGNQMKMREALERVVEIADREWKSFRETPAMKEMRDVCTSALSAPARQCDVGTPEVQKARWKGNCGHGIPNCTHCKVYGYAKEHGLVSDRGLLRCRCEFIWAQMPYEAEEGGKGDGM